MAASSKSDDTNGSKSGLMVAVLLLTAIAGGGGWLIGEYVIGGTVADNAAPASGEKLDRPKPGSFQSRSIGELFELKPIVTNLAAPKSVWVRLEAALVAKPGEVVEPHIVAQVNDDFLAFLRSANLMQLQGATGLSALRADLEERARMRTDGRIERVFISSLVME